MRLLLVEDQARTADDVAHSLNAAGFELDVASDGLAGRHFIEQHDYALIILDAMLPGHTGWRLLKLVRQRGTTPVLFLTAGESMEDRLRGLELGADDYLLKPFTAAELLTRVGVLLRRGPLGEAQSYQIADLEIDVALRQASRGGQRIALAEREFDLLELLASRHGDVVSRAVISAQLGNLDVDIAIQRLRVKIDQRYSPPLIQQVKALGFLLAASDTTTPP